MSMSTFVIGVLGTDRVVRVATTANLAKFLRNKRDRKQQVLPLFAVQCDEVDSYVLPDATPVEAAGVLFGAARTEPAALAIVLRHIARMDPAVRGELVRCWSEAASG